MKIHTRLGEGLLETQICSILHDGILGFIITAGNTSVITKELCNVRVLLNYLFIFNFFAFENK